MSSTRVFAQALSVATAALLLASGADAGKCCYFDASDCDHESNWCSKDAAHCKRCGGSYSDAKSQEQDAAPVKKESAAAHPQLYIASACQVDTGGTCRIMGCDKSRGSTNCVDHKCVCKQGYCMEDGKCVKEQANSTAVFLGMQESGASDPVSLSAVAGLAVAGFAMMLMASVRSTRRTVTMNSEVLG